MTLFLDTETTGHWDFKADPLAEHQPHIVQLAALLVAEDGNTVAGSMNFIIEPAGWDISAEVTKVHHISKELAAAVGVPRKVALAAFNHLVKHARRIVAHNLNFDWNVLVAQFAREQQKHRMDVAQKICTMMAATPVLKLPKPFVPRGGHRAGDEWKWPTLTETYAFYFDGKQFDGAHNAMADVLACAAVYHEMLRRKHIPA